ncbi:MAG: flagellar biosynthesis protein FlhB [Alphaproteobacteria bacterium]|nr:flagellar biosynthesis protein FlhB [Alphaproteobacteria bacterium]
MAEDQDSRTEQPTGRRLSKARDDGDVPISREIGHVLMLLGALIVVGTMAPWIAKNVLGLARAFIERPHVIDVGPDGIRIVSVQMMWRVGLLLGLPVLLLTILAITSTIGQVGALYTPKKIMPKLSNLSVISGFKRLFSFQSVFEALKGIIKIVVIGVVLGAMVWPSMRHPEQIMGQDLMTTISNLHMLIVMVLMFTVLTMAVLSAVDFAYTRYAHTEKLKMTKQEVKDEHKETEGDPKVKGRIRALRMERHRKRMMAAVPKATVVITNPTHFAVALKYDIDSMAAPMLVAKGADYIAKRIRQIADTHEVPIVENPPLARALYAAVEVDQEIPQEHYKAVAEIIGYVMRLKGKLLAKH